MKKFLFIFLVVALPFWGYSQKPRIIPVDDTGKEIPIGNSKWMSGDDINFLKTIRLNYRTPSLFSEIPIVECFKGNPRLEFMLGCAGNQLISHDKEFIAFIPLKRFLSKKDSIDLRKSFPGASIPDLNSQHIYSIRAQVLSSLGKDASLKGENASFNWRKYVRYYSCKDAKQKFNADTAITYSITLNGNEIYKSKYRFLKILVLQKKDRGFIEMYSFYSGKNNTDFNKYWSLIESAFKYD